MRTRLTIALLGVTLLALSACSSSKSGSTKASGSAGSAANTDTIALTTFGQFDAPVFSYPEAPVIQQAVVAAVNKAGGVNGHQIKLQTCNDQNVQTVAVSCVRDAIGSDAVALLTPFDRYGDAITPLLAQANLVLVGNTASTVGDFTSPISVPTNAPQGYIGGLVETMITRGSCKTVDFIHYDSPGSAIAKPLIQKVVADAGAKYVDTNVGTGAADYGPIAAQISAAGATCAFDFLPGTDSVKWVLAQKQRDPNFLISAGVPALAPLLPQLGASGNGLLLGSSFPDVSDTSNADVAKFRSEMKAAGVKDSQLTNIGMQAWGSIKLLFGAISTIKGKVTRENVLAAMNNISTPATNLFGNYNTTKPNSQKDFARLFGTEAYLYTTNNGILTSLGAPVDSRSQFN